MAAGYLGQFPIDIKDTPYKDYTPADWALKYIQKYGGIGGDHHKSWVMDQVARILHGTPISLVEARWTEHKPELRFWTGKPTKAYRDWVAECKNGKDGPETYNYDVGIAP